MRTQLRWIGAALGGGLLLSLPAAGAGTPGVTSTQILLGGTAPPPGAPSFSAGAATGADAYFKYVNGRGGVNGRRIEYDYLENEDAPATEEAVKRLVSDEKVFALFNMLGTEESLAARTFLNGAHVPQLFVGSSAGGWGRDYRRYPWSIGYAPSYTAEGIIYGRYLARARPRARIAILLRNDAYTNDLTSGLKQGLAGKGQIVATERYAPTATDVRLQIAKLKASKANTLMIFATGRFAVEAFVQADRLNWKARVFVNQAASASSLMQLAAEGGANRLSEGAITIGFLKDPAGGKWATDPAMLLYRRIIQKFEPRANPRDLAGVYGMAVAFTMVDTLKQAGRNLTRQGVMRAATSLNERNNPFLLPGIFVRTSPTNRFPILKAQLERWHKTRWVPFGGLVDARG